MNIFGGENDTGKMNRIAKVFATLKKQNRKALIPFITAGDPNPQITVQLMHQLVQLPLALIVCSTWSSYAQEALQAGVKGYLLLPLEDWDVKKHVASAVPTTKGSTRKPLNQYH